MEDELARLIREQEKDDTHRILREEHVRYSLDAKIPRSDSTNGDYLDSINKADRRTPGCPIHGQSTMVYRGDMAYPVCRVCTRESCRRYQERKRREAGAKKRIFGECQKGHGPHSHYPGGKPYCAPCLTERETNGRGKGWAKGLTKGCKTHGLESWHVTSKGHGYCKIEKRANSARFRAKRKEGQDAGSSS